jgi:hypothetical protein
MNWALHRDEIFLFFFSHIPCSEVVATVELCCADFISQKWYIWPQPQSSHCVVCPGVLTEDVLPEDVTEPSMASELRAGPFLPSTSSFCGQSLLTETLGNCTTYWNRFVLVRLFITVTNTWGSNFRKRKDLFWLTTSKVSVHGHLAPSACAETEHHGGEHVAEPSCSPHGCTEVKRGIQEGATGRYISKDTHVVTYFLLPGLTSCFHATIREPSFNTMSPWGRFHVQT